jgi:dual specificity tyrosine-phosphorylation-regulated kinase 1
VIDYINSRRQRRAQLSAMNSQSCSSTSADACTVGALMADASFSESDHDAHGSSSSASDIDSDSDSDNDIDGMLDCATGSNDKNAFLATLDDDVFMSIDSAESLPAVAPESAFSGRSALVPARGPRPSLLPVQDARALLLQHGGSLPRRQVVSDLTSVLNRSRQALSAGFGAKDAAVSVVARASAALTRTYSNINRSYYQQQQQKQQQAQQQQVQHAVQTSDASSIGVGSVLNGRYSVVRALGAGSFGAVFECTDALSGARVAVKMMTSPDAATDEIDVLRMLNSRDPMQRFGVVRLLDTFVLPTRATCLVFELLSLNLYDIIRNTDHQGISLHLVRKFGRQLLQTLEFLRCAHLVPQAVDVPQPTNSTFVKPTAGIVHCDVKPENILLCSTKKAQIRLIDFGSACLSSDHPAFTYVQSRFYRAPEVLLNLPYSHPVDVWSAACVLAELHTGRPLFPGRSEAEQISLHASVLGSLPPVHMIECSGGGRGLLYFKRTPSAYTLNASVCPVIASAPLHVTLGVYSGGPGGRRAGEKSGHTRADYEAFYDLLMRMLAYDPSQRLTPAQALAHPFFACDEAVSQPAAAAVATQMTDASMQSVKEVTPFEMAATAGLSARSQAYLQSASYARLAAKVSDQMCHSPLTPAVAPSSVTPSLPSMSLGTAWHSSKVGRAPAQPLAAAAPSLPMPRQVPLGANAHRAKEQVRARAVAETQRKAQRRAAVAQWHQQHGEELE